MQTIKTIFIAIFLGILLVPMAARAQEPAALTVTPAIVEVNLDPGQKITKTITVFNNNSSAQPILLSAKSLLPADELLPQADLKRYDASQWISFAKKAYAIKALQSVTIEFNIDAPENASPGGHYAEVIVDSFTLVAPDQNQSASKVYPQLKVPVLINISGQVNNDLSLEQSQVLHLLIQKGANNHTTLTLVNNGNTHLLPTVSIELINSGKVAHKETFSSLLVLPGTKKDYKFVWSTNADYGKYDARLSVSYGSDGQSITQQNTVFIAPKAWQIILFFSALAAVFYLIIHRRNIKKAAGILLGKDHNVK